VTPQEDARDAYDDAVRRAVLIKDAWVALGEPITAFGSTGQLIAHPLLKAMNDAELLADRLRQRLTPRHPGPDPVASVAAKIGLSPAAKLRARARGEGA